MTLDDIQAKVTAETSVIDSAVTLLGQLAQLIRDNANDPTKLQALADSIDADTGKLAAAVTANTPI